MEKNKKDWIHEMRIGGVSLVISTVYFILTFFVKKKAILKFQANSIAPSFFPRIVAIIAIITSLSILISAYIQYRKAPEAKNGESAIKYSAIFTKDRLVILCSMIVFLLIVKPVGYIISTLALSLGLLQYFKPEKLVRNIVFSLVFSVGCFFIFNNLLQIWLPVGILKFLG